jgi:Arc/MetJ-type ribon-helix-helix transcriptional regulator
MKQKMSITIEIESVKKIESLVSDGAFRNKSHVMEFALNKLIKEKENE